MGRITVLTESGSACVVSLDAKDTVQKLLDKVRAQLISSSCDSEIAVFFDGSPCTETTILNCGSIRLELRLADGQPFYGEFQNPIQDLELLSPRTVAPVEFTRKARTSGKDCAKRRINSRTPRAGYAQAASIERSGEVELSRDTDSAPTLLEARHLFETRQDDKLPVEPCCVDHHHRGASHDLSHLAVEACRPCGKAYGMDWPIKEQELTERLWHEEAAASELLAKQQELAEDVQARIRSGEDMTNVIQQLEEDIIRWREEHSAEMRRECDEFSRIDRGRIEELENTERRVSELQLAEERAQSKLELRSAELQEKDGLVAELRSSLDLIKEKDGLVAELRSSLDLIKAKAEEEQARHSEAMDVAGIRSQKQQVAEQQEAHLRRMMMDATATQRENLEEVMHYKEEFEKYEFENAELKVQLEQQQLRHKEQCAEMQVQLASRNQDPKARSRSLSGSFMALYRRFCRTLPARKDGQNRRR